MVLRQHSQTVKVEKVLNIDGEATGNYKNNKITSCISSHWTSISKTNSSKLDSTWLSIKTVCIYSEINELWYLVFPGFTFSVAHT